VPAAIAITYMNHADDPTPGHTLYVSSDSTPGSFKNTHYYFDGVTDIINPTNGEKYGEANSYRSADGTMRLRYAISRWGEFFGQPFPIYGWCLSVTSGGGTSAEAADVTGDISHRIFGAPPAYAWRDYDSSDFGTIAVSVVANPPAVLSGDSLRVDRTKVTYSIVNPGMTYRDFMGSAILRRDYSISSLKRAYISENGEYGIRWEDGQWRYYNLFSGQIEGFSTFTGGINDTYYGAPPHNAWQTPMSSDGIQIHIRVNVIPDVSFRPGGDLLVVTGPTDYKNPNGEYAAGELVSGKKAYLRGGDSSVGSFYIQWSAPNKQWEWGQVEVSGTRSMLWTNTRVDSFNEIVYGAPPGDGWANTFGPPQTPPTFTLADAT
jgi:hypothetical protein